MATGGGAPLTLCSVVLIVWSPSSDRSVVREKYLMSVGKVNLSLISAEFEELHLESFG